MKPEKYIEHNNNLRTYLNEENNKYYEELLIQTRLLSFFKNEQKVEEVLLDILQDLIDYQKAGKNFVDVYGDNIHKIAKDIVKNILQDNILKNLKLVLLSVIMFIVSSFFISISFKQSINILEYVFSYTLTIVIIAVALFILIKMLHKLKPISSLIILMIFFNAAIFIPILASRSIDFYNMANGKFNISVTTSLIVAVFLATVIVTFSIAKATNSYKILLPLLIPQFANLVLVFLFKNSTSTQSLIVSSVILVISFIIALTIVYKNSK